MAMPRNLLQIYRLSRNSFPSDRLGELRQMFLPLVCPKQAWSSCMCAKQKPKATLSAVREAQDKNHLAILDDKGLASLFKKDDKYPNTPSFNLNTVCTSETDLVRLDKLNFTGFFSAPSHPRTLSASSSPFGSPSACWKPLSFSGSYDLTSRPCWACNIAGECGNPHPN